MDELTDRQTEELVADLLALRDELNAALSGDKNEGRIIELDQPIGRLTRMDAIQQQKMVEAGRRQMQVRMGHVKAALARHADDEYGYCRKCDEPIGYARLKVRPEAPFCVACQNALESGKR